MRPLSSSPDLRFWSLLSPSFHAGDHDVNDDGEKEDDNGDHDEEYEGDDDDDQEESKPCSPASSQLTRVTHSCACHRLGAWSSSFQFSIIALLVFQVFFISIIGNTGLLPLQFAVDPGPDLDWAR